MLDFLTSDNIYVGLLLIIPGLIIVYIRSRFLTGKRPSHTDNILSYVVVSIIYYVVTSPLIEPLLNERGPLPIRTLIWGLILIVGPALLGLFLAAWVQKEWGGKSARLIGLSPVHVIPAAWDWRFSKLPAGGLFVLVTLTEGSRVAGFFGSNSFASSDTSERDIYVEEEYDIDEDDVWMPRPSKAGILISAKEIRHIEFFEPGETT